MQAKLEKLDGEPIIVVTYDTIDVETVKQVWARSVELAGDAPVLYRISDFTNADGNMEDMRAIIELIDENKAGSSVDGRFKLIFVGRTDMTWFYETMLERNQHTVAPIPFFETVDEALNYARGTIEHE